MTTVQWSDGDILTAGSLRLLPQFYEHKTFANSPLIWPVSGLYLVGSVFVSGGQFSEQLMVDLGGKASSSAGTSLEFQLFMSGAGLGGGSLIGGVGVNSASSLYTNVPFSIGSNSGWIPGSDVVAQFFGDGVGGTNGSTISYISMRVYGTGG